MGTEAKNPVTKSAKKPYRKPVVRTKEVHRMKDNEKMKKQGLLTIGQEPTMAKNIFKLQRDAAIDELERLIFETADLPEGYEVVVSQIAGGRVTEISMHHFNPDGTGGGTSLMRSDDSAAPYIVACEDFLAYKRELEWPLHDAQKKADLNMLLAETCQRLNRLFVLNGRFK
jgi:hypothetical protein